MLTRHSTGKTDDFFFLFPVPLADRDLQIMFLTAALISF